MSDEKKQHCITICCDCGTGEARADACCGSDTRAESCCGGSRKEMIDKLSEIVEQLKQSK